ncbi:methyltransferase domain-containing protein [Methanothrix sp.]|uniref:methyltransferase domain-containing protein n=1 Tax=Methanothrix sp. TaxID=90426 RepID=UPI003C7777E6
MLDVGAGPGTLAIPLARRVRRVTAIGPSRPMICCLERHLAEEKLSNVFIINYNMLYDWGLYPDVEVLQQTSFSRVYADCRRLSPT